MVEGIAERISGWLVRNGAEAEDREVFVYTLTILINEIVVDIILLIAAALLGCLWEMLAYLIAFGLLRSNIGGLHAASATLCLVLSAACPILSMLLVPVAVPYVWLIPIQCIGCLAVVFAIAPVTHPNRPTTERQLKKAKRNGRVFCVSETVLIALLLLLKLYAVAHAAAIGMTTAVVLCVLGKLFNHRAKM